MKKYFIISTGSGSYNPMLKKQIRRIYSQDQAHVYKTQHPGHLEDLVKTHVDEDCIIYICGGDGSLGEAAPYFIGKRASLGLIPMGTANDFSKNFDYKNFSIENTLDPQLVRADLIRVNESYSINVFSFGLDTLVLSETYKILKKFPFLNEKAYLFGVWPGLFKYKAGQLDIYLSLENGEDLEISGKFLLGALCNGGFYGSGFNPSPKADITDGVLEFVLAKDMGILKLLRLVSRYKKGRHLGHERILDYRVKSGSITSKTDLLANLDGLILRDKIFEFEIIKGAISYALPS